MTTYFGTRVLRRSHIAICLNGMFAPPGFRNISRPPPATFTRPLQAGPTTGSSAWGGPESASAPPNLKS